MPTIYIKKWFSLLLLLIQILFSLSTFPYISLLEVIVLTWCFSSPFLILTCSYISEKIYHVWDIIISVITVHPITYPSLLEPYMMSWSRSRSNNVIFNLHWNLQGVKMISTYMSHCYCISLLFCTKFNTAKAVLFNSYIWPYLYLLLKAVC